MEFFVFHRDRPGSLPARDDLLQEHWSYMDRFATGMIARGPVFTADGETLVGSVHIVDLPDLTAGRAFALQEPYYQAGVFRDVLLRRWRNVLGRTMWEFPGGTVGEDDGGYLVLGLGTAPVPDSEATDEVLARDAPVAYGPLLSDDGRTRVGTAALVQAASAAQAREVLDPDDGMNGDVDDDVDDDVDGYAVVEVYRWQFGGRR
ncbi:YciI family protein [Kineosporia sp. NBRC 101731]|uniref:YciI family protein n=1 Tax=Kineosporia sp. NBRC 101731 TaxID=3032199 RepID=UPI0025543614|nr:YciI family protein [Kineosporia sp. NBRC 101731]